MMLHICFTKAEREGTCSSVQLYQWFDHQHPVLLAANTRTLTVFKHFFRLRTYQPQWYTQFGFSLEKEFLFLVFSSEKETS
jgi:hypothetical protein